jgi:hypothetical protein
MGMDDADKAEKLIRNLAQRLERDWSGVSGSILERGGWAERAADLGSGRNSLMIIVGWLSRPHHPARIRCGGTGCDQWDRGCGHSIFL